MKLVLHAMFVFKRSSPSFLTLCNTGRINRRFGGTCCLPSSSLVETSSITWRV